MLAVGSIYSENSVIIIAGNNNYNETIAPVFTYRNSIQKLYRLCKFT